MKKLGVEIRLDTIIGKLFTIPQLLTDMGYDAAFVGTGAGRPSSPESPARRSTASSPPMSSSPAST